MPGFISSSQGCVIVDLKLSQKFGPENAVGVKAKTTDNILDQNCTYAGTDGDSVALKQCLLRTKLIIYLVMVAC